ncbi:hypothetical protein ACQP1O_16860 [Nocardia sp. CA-151230]|uniref:hypothetical protein n=1 Tax=Nocardia sp. CA-151230 TaxID=3239982 RepID=UPI003D8EC768
MDGDEIQYQTRGHRTLLTQRGIVDLGPGDFIRIPLGIAHADVGDESSEYISLLSYHELPQVADTSHTGEPYSTARLDAIYSKAAR